MMLKQATLAAIVAIAITATAFAQEDQVATNYALYRVAIENGDMARAESAAVAALTASQARDGNGGNTATLAYNLAIVRIDSGRAAEASDPAALALRIVEATPGNRLDILLARLVHGQTQLAAAPEQGVIAIQAALAEARVRRDVDDRAFRAAAALGIWALEHEQYQVAQTAWAQAVEHVRGDSPADVLARERARTAQAVATIAQHAGNERAAARDQAYAMLTDSMDALYPYAIELPADNTLTPFQAAFAEAAGWRSYGRAAYTPRESINLRDLRGEVQCDVSWSGGRGVGALLSGAFDGATGVAVFRILTSDTGDQRA